MSKVVKCEADRVEAEVKKRILFSLLSRVIRKVATYSPHLADLLKKSPAILLKLATKGQGENAGSREVLKQAFRKLADHPAFRKCLKDRKL